MTYGDEEFTINSLATEALDILKDRGVKYPSFAKIESAVDEVLAPTFMSHFRSKRRQIIMVLIQRIKTLREEKH